MFKRNIPNYITLLNLFSGCIAVLFAVNGDFVGAAAFVALGIFFDFFDGLAARSLGVSSKLGLELDSLADMVTSGVVPGIVMMKLLEESFTIYSGKLNVQPEGFMGDVFNYLPLIGFAVTLASAYRLAKFNIDDRQTSSFIGLPTPANALLILSIPLIIEYQETPALEGFLLNPWWLLGLTAFSSYILNAELPLFALKFSKFSWKTQGYKLVFLVLCLILLGVLKFIAVPIIIIAYVLLSVILNKLKLTRD